MFAILMGFFDVTSPPPIRLPYRGADLVPYDCTAITTEPGLTSGIWLGAFGSDCKALSFE